jgi:hypothetical protein
MSIGSGKILDADSARAVVETYEVVPGIFVLGTLSTGVTVYRQQVRAHNLVSALEHLAAKGDIRLKDVAVVGGGISGLTVTAALVALDANVRVTLFEKRWDLCPLQQGCDTRWLHPKIYDWPALGSRAKESDLPVLPWREGRASDVAAAILKRFSDYCMWSGGTCEETSTPGQERIRIFLGLSHLSIDGPDRRIEWMGHLAERQGSHFRAREPEGDTHQFDAIVVAVGFGLELGYNTEQVRFPGSYWRSDMLGQPALAGATSTYIVSGYGDGAIIDLCRLTIERFRQDVILEELFGSAGLDETEELFRPLIRSGSSASGINLKTLIENYEQPFDLVKMASKQLSYRIRKDTTVILHARGTGTSAHSISKIFESKTSVANRLLLYMLYRAGAFLVRFQELENVKLEFTVPSSGIIQRHGTSAKDAVLSLFTDQSVVESKLDGMKARDDQSTDGLYPLGSFPPVPEGAKP